MSRPLPITTQRQILKLEQRVFKQQQQIIKLKEKHEREILRLKAEIEKARLQPVVLTDEKREELRDRLARLQTQNRSI